MNVSSSSRYAWVVLGGLACALATRSADAAPPLPSRTVVPSAPSSAVEPSMRTVPERSAPGVLPGDAVPNATSKPVPAELAPPPIPRAPLVSRKPGLQGRVFDLELHGGALIPGAELYRHARTNAIYGGGIGKEVVLGRPVALRATLAYSHAQLAAKPAGLTGHLTLNAVTLRADLLLAAGRVRPFVGAGLGVFPWRGKVRQPVSDQTNSRVSTDFGGLVAVGLDITASRRLSLAPELSWTRIAGDFSQMLWSAALAVRWRL